MGSRVNGDGRVCERIPLCLLPCEHCSYLPHWKKAQVSRTLLVVPPRCAIRGTIAVKTLPESTGSAPQVSTDADGGSSPTKPKRTRRVGEPKPERYPVGEKDSEQGMSRRAEMMLSEHG
jgi:hypothetical protein